MMLLNASLLTAFLVGLLGGVHCAGMCGGLVSALSMQLPQKRQWRQALVLNTGRIMSYTLLGVLVGWIGSWGLLLHGLLPVEIALYLLANLLLIGIGLYLSGLSHVLTRLEALGRHLWRRVQPLMRHLLPAHTWPRALGLGGLWGLMPCGMVYSILLLALLAGSAGQGGSLMLAFGLGTLPNLLLAGLMLARLRAVTHQKVVRLLAGILVLSFGLVGIGRAAWLASHGLVTQICHTTL